MREQERAIPPCHWGRCGAPASLLVYAPAEDGYNVLEWGQYVCVPHYLAYSQRYPTAKIVRMLREGRGAAH